MRSTEAVEEVQEGNLALDGAQMCDRGQIHNFLHAALDQMCIRDSADLMLLTHAGCALKGPRGRFGISSPCAKGGE